MFYFVLVINIVLGPFHQYRISFDIIPSFFVSEKNNFEDPVSPLYAQRMLTKNFYHRVSLRSTLVSPSLRNFHHIWRMCNILFTCDLPASAPTLLWSLPS